MHRTSRCLCVLAIVIAIASAVSADVPPAQARQLHGANSIQLLAHRGAPEFIPEHTFGSYSLAIRQKVDYIEPDICLTSDGHAICMHDFELSSTTDVADHPEFASKRKTVTLPGGTTTGWFTNDFTLAEIKTLRVKQRLQNRDLYYDGLFEVPTLNETLHMLKEKNEQLGLKVGIYIEPKHPAYFASKGLQFDAHLLQVLTENGYTYKRGEGVELSKLIIECFESTQLERLRPLMDVTFVQLIKEPWEKADDTGRPFAEMMSKNGMQKIATYANAIGPVKNYFEPQDHKFISKCPPDTLIAQDAVDEAHRLNLVIHPWTARNAWEDPLIDLYFDRSEEQQLLYLFNLGIDGIFTESAAAAYYSRIQYQSQFASLPTAPSPPPHRPSSPLALYILIPLLCSLFTLLFGLAVGRYCIPYSASDKSQEALSLLNAAVQ